MCALYFQNVQQTNYDPDSPINPSLHCSRERRSVIADETREHVLEYRRESLNCFLSCCGIDPVPKTNKICDHSERTKRLYVSKACDIISIVIKLIYPPDPGSIWKSLKESSCMDNLLGIDPEERRIFPEESKYLYALSEAYQNATTWATRRQILSVMADIAPYKTLVKFIPGLTQYRVTEARKHKTLYGRGTQVPLIRQTRLRVNLCQLEDFINYITSSYVVQDLPFGEKKLQLESGEVIRIPNVIRVSISERIIDQYLQYAKETEKQTLSRSTLRRVLSVCSASTRKSLQGLDYFAADGGKAFDDLVRIVNTLEECGMAPNRAGDFKRRLLSGKQYSKSDYKVNT